MKRQAFVLLLVISAIGVGDAILKAWGLTSLPDEQTAVLHPILTLAIHRNPGIAFDIPLPLSIVLPITFILIGILGYVALKRWHTEPPQALCAVAAMIGALGNAADRLINGFTTDYLIFFKTSAINLSDVLILIGVIGIIWYDQRIPTPASSPAKKISKDAGSQDTN